MLAAVRHCRDLGPTAGWTKNTYHRRDPLPLAGRGPIVKFIAQLQVTARYPQSPYNIKSASLV